MLRLTFGFARCGDLELCRGFAYRILPNAWWQIETPAHGAEDGVAPKQLDFNIWFATGGHAARVFHSPDGGETWQVVDPNHTRVEDLLPVLVELPRGDVGVRVEQHHESALRRGATL